jgi:hypothetical protein
MFANKIKNKNIEIISITRKIGKLLYKHDLVYKIKIYLYEYEIYYIENNKLHSIPNNSIVT